MEQVLTSEKVRDIFGFGLFKDDEIENGKPTGDFIEVEGVTGKFGFHPRIKDKKEEIQTLINELNPNFKEGWTFLNLPFDKHDNHWGEHLNCEQLYVISKAVGLAQFSMPREMWEVLPGGMPYIAFEIQEVNPT